METFTGNSSSKLKYLTIMMISVHFHLVYLQICNYIETVIAHKTRQHSISCTTQQLRSLAMVNWAEFDTSSQLGEKEETADSARLSFCIQLSCWGGFLFQPRIAKQKIINVALT